MTPISVTVKDIKEFAERLFPELQDAAAEAEYLAGHPIVQAAIRATHLPAGAVSMFADQIDALDRHWADRQAAPPEPAQQEPAA
ncbi:MAG TPA: hypothetical protein VIX86_17190 [Streptosporangiaceae bacterium]